LHTVEVWERDRTKQPPNPANCDEEQSWDDFKASYGADWDGGL
jgi:hypothetical protein